LETNEPRLAKRAAAAAATNAGGAVDEPAAPVDGLLAWLTTSEANKIYFTMYTNIYAAYQVHY